MSEPSRQNEASARLAQTLEDAGYWTEATLIRAGWEPRVMLARLRARAGSLPREQAFYGAAVAILEQGVNRV